MLRSVQAVDVRVFFFPYLIPDTSRRTRFHSDFILGISRTDLWSHEIVILFKDIDYCRKNWSLTYIAFMNFAVSVRSFFSGRSRMVYIKARRREFLYTLISLNIYHIVRLSFILFRVWLPWQLSLATLKWKAAFFSTVGEDTISSTHISGALARASARSGAPWIRKNDNLQMREFLVTTWTSVVPFTPYM